MTADLVARLRGRKIRLHADDYCLMQDAADEIEKLRAEAARLRVALEWIANPMGNDFCTPAEIARETLKGEP
jgi:hypothetical protein